MPGCAGYEIVFCMCPKDAKRGSSSTSFLWVVAAQGFVAVQGFGRGGGLGVGGYSGVGFLEV